MSTIDALNRFVQNPTNLDIGRSRFKRPYTHKTTMCSGECVPIFWDEVLPGDTFDLNVSSVIRMLSPVLPVMDNSFLDLYFFFVPNRLACVHEHDWAKICGENFDGFWADTTEHSLESTGNTILLSNYDCHRGSIASFLGIPVHNYKGTSSNYRHAKINTLPFIAYAKIWNEWFRDQNLQAPIVTESPQAFLGRCFSGRCYPVNKLHDYFTSTLPQPQKGESVLLPLGDTAPVLTNAVDYPDSLLNKVGMRLSGFTQYGVSTSGPWHTSDTSKGIPMAPLRPVNDGSIALGSSSDSSTTNVNERVVPSNLYADLANATASSVSQLRQAFAIQRMLEKDARGGRVYA